MESTRPFFRLANAILFSLLATMTASAARTLQFAVKPATNCQVYLCPNGSVCTQPGCYCNAFWEKCS